MLAMREQRDAYADKLHDVACKLEAAEARVRELEAGVGAILAHTALVECGDARGDWAFVQGICRQLLATADAIAFAVLRAAVEGMPDATEWDDAEKKLVPIRGCVQVQTALVSRTALLAALTRGSTP
jgi:hypothetical protein